ncbi:hypothetical protein [Ornithinimicrobium pratense]|uniref:DUF4352 domain-containing protein n=1 Tax=Ornithinimicrobium pratense TaxID=2593973 RepID=A0A5J6V5K1_9MICO|nr:hypothetical protein [Ornithinimicrobium pratense]QFG69055.1 hypothetical protein FY030_10375 [Ornithinimicrobium pratense]
MVAVAMMLPLAACSTTPQQTVVTETVTAAAPAQTTTEGEAEVTSEPPVPTSAEAEPTTEEPTTEATVTEEETTEDDESAKEGEPDFGESETSERGLLIKEIGQAAGIGDPADEATVAFTLTDVVVDFECTADPMMVDPPANGHYVAFEWEVETGSADAMTEAFYDSSFTLSEWDLSVLDENGKLLNDISGNALWCVESADSLPTAIGPKQTASGLIVLDLEVTSGILVVNGSSWGVQGGWEWAF